MPTVWKIVDDLPRAVHCNVFGYTKRDADGATMYSNTHFATEADAWEHAEDDAAAHVRLAARDVENARATLRKAEQEAADAVVHAKKVHEARRRRERELGLDQAADAPGTNDASAASGR